MNAATNTTEQAEQNVSNGIDPKLKPVMVFAWLWVAAPFTYGLWKLFEKIDALFT
ncbi:MFS transporter small subunit [Sporichthya polymorpha]|uniref:MFS transporter small subunit n=1 Tax=Sporichthya polymorpha TaxID=35751 RepID=UPI0003625AF5|nr:hypothetical protein [Sporichthya polymorpha]